MESLIFPKDQLYSMYVSIYLSLNNGLYSIRIEGMMPSHSAWMDAAGEAPAASVAAK